MLQIRSEYLAGEAQAECGDQKISVRAFIGMLPLLKDPELKTSTLTNKCDSPRLPATACVPITPAASLSATLAYSKNDSNQMFLILIH